MCVCERRRRGEVKNGNGRAGSVMQEMREENREEEAMM